MSAYYTSSETRSARYAVARPQQNVLRPPNATVISVLSYQTDN